MPTIPTRITEREVLPTNVKPTHYDLRFEPHLEQATEFDGSAVIDLDVAKDSSSITLNAFDLDIKTTEVAFKGGATIRSSAPTFNTAKQWMIIDLREEVKSGSKLVLKITFKGSMLHRQNGFYRAPVNGPNGKTSWIGSTHMEPTDARKVFPCWDEPALKAAFTITLVAERHLTCLGNMNVASEVELV